MADELREISNETLQWADNIAASIYEQVVESGHVRQHIPGPESHIERMPSKDLPGFFDLVRTTMIDFQNRQGVINKDRVSLVEEAPPIDLKTETISYKVIRRVPGAQTGSVPDIMSDSGVKREWRPRIRYQTKDPLKPLKSIAVMGQHFDNVIEFTCWAATNKAANARAFWFEDFMVSYHWYFKYMGIQEIIYLQRMEDRYWEDIKTEGNLLKSRSLQYYVRTDRTYEISETVLRDILINVAVGTD